MIEYRAMGIAEQLGVLSVIVELQREPLDMTFAAFIAAELETKSYDAVLTAIITEMDRRGKIHEFYEFNTFIKYFRTTSQR